MIRTNGRVARCVPISSQKPVVLISPYSFKQNNLDPFDDFISPRWRWTKMVARQRQDGKTDANQVRENFSHDLIASSKTGLAAAKLYPAAEAF